MPTRKYTTGITLSTGGDAKIRFQMFSNTASNVLTWTVNSGVLPSANQDAYIVVCMNGQELLPSQYTITADTAPNESEIEIDSDSYVEGANCTVRAFYL